MLDGRPWRAVSSSMRRLLSLFALLALGPNAFAVWYPVVDPKEIRVKVGSTRTVTVRALSTGLMAVPWRPWPVWTTDPYVAVSDVTIERPETTEVPVTGIAPGRTFLMIGSTRSSYVTIDVSCGREEQATAVEPVVVTRVGTPVTLRLSTPIAHRTTFAWYRGRLGDQSAPLSASGPEIELTPATVGEHHAWVLASTPCSITALEFRIDAHGVRRRTIRR